MRLISMALAGALLSAPALAAPVTREVVLAAALGNLGVPLSSFADHSLKPPTSARAPWTFAFFKAPEPVRPGICRSRVARASVYADKARPSASWLVLTHTEDSYRLVGPLDGAPAATRCDGLTPVAQRFDTMPAPVPSGAFRAPSALRAWEAASRFRDVLGVARGAGGLPFTLVCDTSGGDDCRVPRATLANFDLTMINQVRECDLQSPRCLVVNVDGGLGDLSFWEVHIETTTSGLQGGRVTMIFSPAPVAPVPPAG